MYLSIVMTTMMMVMIIFLRGGGVMLMHDLSFEGGKNDNKLLKNCVPTPGIEPGPRR